MRIAPTDAAPALQSDARIEPKLTITPVESTTSPAVTRFSELLGEAVETASTRAADAAQKTELLATGQSDDIHGTMIAVKEAEISTKLVGSIRNKLIDAFHELWRTSV